MGIKSPHGQAKKIDCNILQLGVITLIPEILQGLQYGVIGRAIQRGIVDVRCWNPRQWAPGPHHAVDDKPYGGGPGMVMTYGPLSECIKHVKKQMPMSCKTIYLSPQGKKICQSDIKNIAQNKQPLLFIAGRYEGIDERVIINHIDEEWSLGDFVLSGGELAAMVFIDAIIRLLPGCLGHVASAEHDSFMQGLLDYPHYTRPNVVDNLAVPEVLLSGNHQHIACWRRKQALGKTWLKRPDLLVGNQLDENDKELLDAFKGEYKSSLDKKTIEE